MGDMRSAYNILAGKAEGKRPLGKPWSRWNHREIGWEDVDWLHLT
jgi:hypothetical protein